MFALLQQEVLDGGRTNSSCRIRGRLCSCRCRETTVHALLQQEVLDVRFTNSVQYLYLVLYNIYQVLYSPTTIPGTVLSYHLRRIISFVDNS